jgi:hypothetical protein
MTDIYDPANPNFVNPNDVLAKNPNDAAAMIAATRLDVVQATILRSVQAQVANINNNLKTNYLTQFNNWAQSVIAGRPNGDPPQPPKAYVVGYVLDQTTVGDVQGPEHNVQWAVPAIGKDPVCPMPPVPTMAPPPPPIPERDDIRNVPPGDTLPVGFKMTDPATGHVYQKQASPTPFGIAYFYARVA